MSYGQVSSGGYGCLRRGLTTSALALACLCGLSWSDDARAGERSSGAVQVAEEPSRGTLGSTFLNGSGNGAGNGIGNGAGKSGGFKGNLRRREKPPDYLLPKKEDDEPAQTQGAPEGSSQGLVPPDTAKRLTELKSVFEKGLIAETEYEASQTRILADITPTRERLETDLRILRELWDRSLITPAPYAQKRQELLDVL